MTLRRRPQADPASLEPATAAAPRSFIDGGAAATREADALAREAGIVTTAPDQRASPVNGTASTSVGFTRIAERVFNLPDPDGEYEELERALSLGSSEFDSIVKAVDAAEDDARRAHRLYVNAKLDYERFAADAALIESAIRTEASAELQREKDSGQRTKQITDADVVAKSAALFPDEWRDLAEKKVRAKLSVEHLERFADLWVGRCRSLGGMLASKR